MDLSTAFIEELCFQQLKRLSLEAARKAEEGVGA